MDDIFHFTTVRAAVHLLCLKNLETGVILYKVGESELSYALLYDLTSINRISKKEVSIPKLREIIQRKLGKKFGWCGLHTTWILDTESGVLTLQSKRAKSVKMADFYPQGSLNRNINAPWWNERNQIVSVEMEDGILNIGTCAFSRCERLEKIAIPDSVQEIGQDAFNGCVNLTSVSIPKGVSKIATGTFEDCVKLVCADIPDSVTVIEDSAFCGCKSLTDIIIPDSVTKIDWLAFHGCDKLNMVSIPENAEINEEAFDPHTQFIRRP